MLKKSKFKNGTNTSYGKGEQIYGIHHEFCPKISRCPNRFADRTLDLQLDCSDHGPPDGENQS